MAHLVYQPKSLIQSYFVVRRRRWHRPALSSSSSVHTSPCHRVRHRNFIFGTHMHICPPHMHIKYLVILTFVLFKWHQFWYFSLICYPAHFGSHRHFTSHILQYLFFTYIHKRNHATITYFLKFISIFLKFIYSSEAPCALTYMHDPLKLSLALLANCVPKCQMSSGPYGPIFNTRNGILITVVKTCTVSPLNS